LAAVLVAVGMYVRYLNFNMLDNREAVEMGVGAAIGMITFTGSIVAALKLQGIVGGRPWSWAGRHIFHLVMALLLVACTAWFVMGLGPAAVDPLAKLRPFDKAGDQSCLICFDDAVGQGDLDGRNRSQLAVLAVEGSQFSQVYIANIISISDEEASGVNVLADTSDAAGFFGQQPGVGQNHLPGWMINVT
jgi:hypothetical protein